jgi:D-serine deaminase-like pyridoxal phosphate-dependent protein
MQQSIEEIDTPAVLVDLDVLDRNLRTKAELAERAGVKLRPHVKTHKSKWIAREQLRYGACGITVAKLGEAEVMADAGITDILVAYPIVGKQKLERLGRLMQRATVAVSTDDLEVAKGLSELGQYLKRKIPVYVDVNTGLNRCGREPGLETAGVVREMSRLQGIEVVGLMTHAGYAYTKSNVVDMRRDAFKEAEGLLRTKEELQRIGIDIREISVGSTPTSRFIHELEGVTEMRPGAYVFGDGMQTACGTAREDNCALHVLATVVSTPRAGTAIIDAGSKTLSSDTNPHRSGYGTLRGQPDVYIERLSEEHGIVRIPDGIRFNIGDRLMFLPNHCCTTVNLHSHLYGLRSDKVERMISVDCRGMVR